MKPKILTTVILIFLVAISCKPKAEPIVYGKENCHYCKMTIVSQQFGSELVTAKGRVYKFDAVECMVHQMAEDSSAPNSLILIHDYISGSDNFTDATQAYYVISEEIQSPMGAHLAGFKNLSQAEQFKNKFGGKILTWEALQTEINH